jgi:hypothetical protein
MTREKFTRKLSTILSADVAGYSRLMLIFDSCPYFLVSLRR